MASIHKKGSGWVVRWREAGRGAPLLSSRTFRSRLQASAEARAIEARLTIQRPGATSATWTLLQVAEHWLAERATEGRAQHGYREHSLRALAAACAGRDWIRPIDVRPEGLGSLRIGHWRVLRATLRHAVRLGQAVSLQTLAYRRPPTRRPAPRPLLTDAQAAALLDAAQRRGPGPYALAHLVSTYGHRPESLVHLTAAALDATPGRPTLTIPVKSGDTIRHPLLPGTATILADLAAQAPRNTPLLRDDTDKPWPSGNKAAQWWYSHVGRPTLPSHPGIYELKRLAISRWLDAGVDLATIASITGHRTPSVLLRYARTNETRQATALAALAPRVPPVFPLMS
ncbi:MAG: Phage integrase family [Pseudomonadota bacterium]|jgi:hypothetical protein